MLSEYDRIVPGLAGRLASLFEGQVAHRQHLERVHMDEGNRRAARGQWFGFSLGFVGLAFGFVLLMAGHDIQGYSLLVGDVATLAGVFAFGRVSTWLERREKRKELEAAERIKRQLPSRPSSP